MRGASVKHEYSKLWTHFGPYGDQTVHVHPCIKHKDCDSALIGDGRSCNGDRPSHQTRDLTEPVNDDHSPLTEEQKIERDVMIHGNGYGRRHPDGRLEHIPAAEMFVHTRKEKP